MSTLDITQLLEMAFSADENRDKAEADLLKYRDENFPGFVLSVIQHIADPSKRVETRHLASIVFKNGLVSLNGPYFVQKREVWIALPAELRAQAKDALLNTLLDPNVTVRRGAATAISAIALIEVPLNQWPQLFEQLMNLILNNPSDDIKASALETIGFICSDFDTNQNVDINSLSQEAVDCILTSIFSGISNTANTSIRYMSINALTHALNFAKKNMSRPEERNEIIRLMLEAAIAPDDEIAHKSMECIATLLECYYDCVEDHIMNIYTVAKAAMLEREETVAIEACNVFQTLLGVEVNLSSQTVSHKYIQSMLPDLVPTICICMTKQIDDNEGDVQTLANASAELLANLALQDNTAVIDIVKPFILSNIQNPDWHFREASVMIYGCVMSGEDCEAILTIINEPLPYIINYITNDSNSMVKDSSAWALGCVCLYRIDIVDATYIQNIMTVLLNGLEQIPRVAVNICQSIGNLASFMLNRDLNDQPSNSLTPFFYNFMQALLKCTDRSDWNENNLQSNCYEAIIQLIDACAADVYTVLEELIPFLINKCIESMHINENTDRALVYGLQIHILDTLCSILRKPIDIKPEQVEQLVSIIEIIMKSDNTSAHSSAMNVISSLCYTLEESFQDYAIRLYPYITTSLQQINDYHTCTMTANMIGDFCTCLGAKTALYSDELFTILIKDLSTPELALPAKPLIIAAVSSIILVIDDEFTKFIDPLMNLSLLAAHATADNNDADMIENVNDLRYSVFELWTSMFISLYSRRQVNIFNNYVNSIITTCRDIVNDPITNNSIYVRILSLVHDLCMGFGTHFAKALVVENWYSMLVEKTFNMEGSSEDTQKDINDIKKWSGM
ncbi:hypothetical protein WA158_008487 [Blastocystis sp. Blastoise]